jgi:hypothetical protein
MSEWLLFNAKWKNFQLYHGDNNLQNITQKNKKNEQHEPH